MHDICGSITINFSAKVSQKRLMEEFGEDMFKDGMISLMNIDNEVLDMEVHQFEITGMDDESEDDYEDYEKKVAL